MDNIEMIPTYDLFPHPQNPRKELGDLDELVDSIKANGVLQNLTVVPRDGGGYTVIIGHRRLAAARRAGLTELPCMIVFCSFEQTATLIQAAKKHGFVNYIPLVFVKDYSPQVLKANMRIVGATEYALVFYKDKLPKFRNGVQIGEDGKNIRGTGHMVFNWFSWRRDGKDIPKIHPAQKQVKVLKQLIEVFTDPGDVVIDPCFGSGATGRACLELNRNFYGFEINKEFYRKVKEQMCVLPRSQQLSFTDLLEI